MTTETAEMLSFKGPYIEDRDSSHHHHLRIIGFHCYGGWYGAYHGTVYVAKIRALSEICGQVNCITNSICNHNNDDLVMLILYIMCLMQIQCSAVFNLVWFFFNPFAMVEMVLI